MALTDQLKTLRAAAILTNSYVASTSENIGGSTRADLVLTFTLASLTSIGVKVLFSYDGTNWKYLMAESVASGVITCTPAVYTFLPASWGASATGTTIRLDVGAPHIKVEAIGNGTLTSSSLTVEIQESDEQ